MELGTRASHEFPIWILLLVICTFLIVFYLFSVQSSANISRWPGSNGGQSRKVLHLQLRLQSMYEK